MADRTTERATPVYRRWRRIARLCHFVDERVAALGLNGVALAMEDSPGRGDPMPLPPLARRYFPDEIIRWRAPLGVRTYNEYGEYNMPEMARSLLAALVQPQEDVNDSATEGGLLYTNRVVVFVPIAAQRFIGSGDALRWGGAALTWAGSPLSWGRRSGLVDGSEVPLFAANESRASDVVDIAGTLFEVVESKLWPGSHCRAELLRQH